MLLMCSVPFGTMQALVLPEEEPVLVYRMPLTQVEVTVSYDEISTEVGQFYQYSERFLGTKDVITTAERRFVLQGLDVKPKAVADTSRTFVLRDKNVKLQLISLSPIGTLAGYNISLPAENHGHPRKPKPAADETFIGTETSHLMPLLEEQLMASSTAKMAEGAAKQIYRIREMRLNLLSGEVEKAPADGKALQQMLRELEQREQELTALFVGRRTVKHHTQILTYTPQDASAKNKESVLLRFSKYFGVVAADDLSGEPVIVRMSKSIHQLAPNDKPSQKAGTSLYYNLPGSGELTITYGDQVLCNKQMEVAQWGVSVPLNSALMLIMPRITFCPLTGNIIAIEK